MNSDIRNSYSLDFDGGIPMEADNPFDDLPDIAPSFARDMANERPDPGEEIICWRGAGYVHSSVLNNPNHYNEEIDWLPKSHCRIDGEPPEAVPDGVRTYEFLDAFGDEHFYDGSEWNREAGWGPFCQCWDYANGDTDDHTPFPHPRELAGRVGALEEDVEALDQSVSRISKEILTYINDNQSAVSELKERVEALEEKADWLDDDMTVVSEALQEKVQALEERVDTLESDDPDDPHAHLPGDLRDPAEWTPEEGERVIVWGKLRRRSDRAYSGTYSTGAVIEEGNPDHVYIYWSRAVAARPVTLRPEEDGDE